MALITCPECGKQVSDRAVSCPDCGYPINAAPAPAAQPDTQKLILLARRARQGSDSATAEKYYAQILTMDPGNWEAIFYGVFYEASRCKILNISSAANSVANCIYSTFAAIGDLKSEEEQDSALKDVTSSAIAIAKLFIQAAVKHYNQHSTASGAYAECVNRVVAATNICSEIENSYKSVLPSKTRNLSDFQRIYISFLTNNKGWYNANQYANTIHRLKNEIGDENPAYALEQKIAAKNSQINSLPTTRTPRAPSSALPLLWVLSIAFLGIGYLLLTTENTSIFLIIGLVFLCLTIFGSSKTPSRAVAQSNMRRVEALKQEISGLENQLRAMRGENVQQSKPFVVQLKLFDTAYDTGGRCNATIMFSFTDAETGKFLGSGTQNQILTLRLDKPTKIKCHVGRGFRDAVVFCNSHRDMKYKVIPNIHSGLRFEETALF